MTWPAARGLRRRAAAPGRGRKTLRARRKSMVRGATRGRPRICGLRRARGIAEGDGSEEGRAVGGSGDQNRKTPSTAIAMIASARCRVGCHGGGTGASSTPSSSRPLSEEWRRNRAGGAPTSHCGCHECDARRSRSSPKEPRQGLQTGDLPRAGAPGRQFRPARPAVTSRGSDQCEQVVPHREKRA